MSRSERHRRSGQADEAQYHAVFPSETETEPMIVRTEEDAAAYPDQVYAQIMSFEEEDDRPPFPPQADFYPQPSPAAPARRQQGPKDRRGSASSPIWALMLVFSLCALAALIYTLFSLRSAYQPFREKVAVTRQDTFAQGILVDGVHIGGMTRPQAEQALQSAAVSGANSLNMLIQVDSQSWILTENELPFRRNLSSVLETAYAIGRQGSPEVFSSAMTPLDYRYAHLYHTVSNPAYFYTQVTYDAEKVRELVGIIESNIVREPVNALVESFDFSTRSFTFTKEIPGRGMDGERLIRLIMDALDRKDYTAAISVNSWEIEPQVTQAALIRSFALVSTYSTETTANANRNNNIDLAARAVNGTVVMPGETFSFNAATGERTTQKGYLPAAAIAGGATVDEVGGGVCQVSSTLFNAAAMADLPVISRSPHTWPSTYVDKGRDATVNWPNLDFSFRNDKNTPIFIVCWYQNRKVTVELYGATLGDGLSIDLETRVVSTTYPPDEPLYERNAALESGTIQEKKKAHIGYEVETYKIYRQNGVEYRRELLCTSSYKMIQQVLEYN